jgi:MFS family permease
LRQAQAVRVADGTGASARQQVRLVVEPAPGGWWGTVLRWTWRIVTYSGYLLVFPTLLGPVVGQGPSAGHRGLIHLLRGRQGRHRYDAADGYRRHRAPRSRVGLRWPGHGMKPLTRFLAANATSVVGSTVTTVAIGVLVVDTLHGSAGEVGLVNAAQVAPYLVFGLVAGVLVDRWRRRPVLVATDLVRGVLLAAIPVLAFAGALRIWTLVVVLFVFGTLSVVNSGAAQSFLPRLVERDRLAHANVRLSQGYTAGQTAGPLVGGGLVGLLTAPLAVLVDAASYLVSGALLATLPVTEPVLAPAARHLGRELLDGLRYVYRHRMLAPFALSSHGWFVCMAATSAVYAPFALRSLHLGAFGYGASLAAAGVGGVLGNLASTRLNRWLGAGRTVCVGLLLSPLAVVPLALAPAGPAGWVLAVAGQFLLGAGIGIDDPMSMAYRQAITPDAMQGRMNTTIRSLNRGAATLGAPVGGLLADTLGYRPVLWLAAAGFAAAALGLLASPYRTARLPGPANPADRHDQRQDGIRR